MQNALRMDPDVFEHHGSAGQILEETSIEERAKYHFYQAKVYAKSDATISRCDTFARRSKRDSNKEEPG